MLLALTYRLAARINDLEAKGYVFRTESGLAKIMCITLFANLPPSDSLYDPPLPPPQT